MKNKKNSQNVKSILNTSNRSSPTVKIKMNKSKVKALMEVFEDNVKLEENGIVNETKSSNVTERKVRNAFEVLLDAKGDTPIKTPRRKVKRCGKNEKIASLEKNLKLDQWLKKN